MRILQVVPAPATLRVCYAQAPQQPGGKSYVLQPVYYLAVVEEVWNGYRQTHLYALDLMDGIFTIITEEEVSNFLGIVEVEAVPDFIEESAQQYLTKQRHP